MSTLLVCTFIGWFLVGYHFLKEMRLPHVVRIEARRIVILIVLTIAAVQITLAARYHNSPPTLSLNSGRYITYLFACFPMMVLSRGGVSRESFSLKCVVLISAVAYAVAATFNATYRLPTDLIEPLDGKYFVGPFLRAGAGYLDPNFLAINLIILLVFSRYINIGRVSRFIVASSCLIGIFLTFSRAAWLVSAILIVAALVRNRSTVLAMAAIGVAVIGLATNQDLFLDEGLFRRFVDEEGASSTADRLRQYVGALSELQNVSFESASFGVGGPDVFFIKHGAHLHNFYLGAFIDGGLISVIAPLVALLLTFWWTGGVSRLLIATWVAMSLFLPNVPDTLYFVISLAVALGLRASMSKVKSISIDDSGITAGVSRHA
ncbi:MAG: hypothetical protein AB7S73_08520 [Aquabacterium sp.]